MANNCYTTYVCVGDPKEIEDLHQKIQEAWNTMKEGIGEIIELLGEDPENYTRRGTIIDYNKASDTELYIYQDTAWREQEGFRQCIEKVYPSIKVYFQDEEPGCNWYVTNSFEYFPERYLFDNCEESLYFETIEEAAECISDVVGYDVEATEEALTEAVDKYNELHDDPDEWCAFRKFELID